MECFLQAVGYSALRTQRGHDVSGGAGRLRSCVTGISDKNILFSGQNLGLQHARTGTLPLCNGFDVDTNAKGRMENTKREQTT